MTSVDRLNTLRGLVKEIDELVERTKEDEKQFNDKLSANRESAWLMFCTEIAPYFELVKKIKPKDGISAETGIDGLKIYFNEKDVCLSRSPSCLTRNGEFRSLEQLTSNVPVHQLTSSNNLVRLPKEFDFELFEKTFTHSVEEEMRMRSELANSNYEQAKAKYEAERSV